MTETGSLEFNKAVLINGDDARPERFNLAAADPVSVKPLRKFEDGTIRSGILMISGGWTSATTIRLHTTLQFLVRSGKISLGDRILGANAFVVVPAGGLMPVITAAEDSELLVIIDAGYAFEEATEGRDIIITDDVYEIEPIVPVIHGRPLTGFERRVLWLDPDTGGDTRLLRIPAGFTGPGPSWHPVNEEIFCLEGEISPARNQLMKPGSFLWNPTRSVHGYHEETVPGCVLLEWHDGPWDLIKYEETEA